MSPAFSKVLLSVEEHEDVGKLSSKPNARQKGLKGEQFYMYPNTDCALKERENLCNDNY